MCNERPPLTHLSLGEDREAASLLPEDHFRCSLVPSLIDARNSSLVVLFSLTEQGGNSLRLSFPFFLHSD